MLSHLVPGCRRVGGIVLRRPAAGVICIAFVGLLLSHSLTSLQLGFDAPQACLVLKQFRRIPLADLEMVLPGEQVSEMQEFFRVAESTL